MANWISKDGKRYPAKEKVVLYDEEGNPSIYDGPDREAVKYLKESGNEELGYTGMHYSEDPDIIYRAHERKQTIPEFCQESIYTKEKREKMFAENEKRVVNHAPPKRSAKKVEKSTGGTNTAGATGHRYGDFGSPEELGGSKD